MRYLFSYIKMLYITGHERSCHGQTVTIKKDLEMAVIEEVNPSTLQSIISINVALQGQNKYGKCKEAF